jgi:hypothetical protein
MEVVEWRMVALTESLIVLALGLIGLKHLTGYALFMCALLMASGHQSHRGLMVNYQIDGSIKVGLHVVLALTRSQRCRSRSRSKLMGLINS